MSSTQKLECLLQLQSSGAQIHYEFTQNTHIKLVLEVLVLIDQSDDGQWDDLREIRLLRSERHQ